MFRNTSASPWAKVRDPMADALDEIEDGSDMGHLDDRDSDRVIDDVLMDYDD